MSGKTAKSIKKSVKHREHTENMPYHFSPLEIHIYESHAGLSAIKWVFGLYGLSSGGNEGPEEKRETRPVKAYPTLLEAVKAARHYYKDNPTAMYIISSNSKANIDGKIQLNYANEVKSFRK